MSGSYMEDVVWEKFRRRLLESHSWPCSYAFKFIVPAEGVGEILGLFEGEVVSTRASSNGRYVSISSEFRVENCDEVVEIYRVASRVKGVISL